MYRGSRRRGRRDIVFGEEELTVLKYLLDWGFVLPITQRQIAQELGMSEELFSFYLRVALEFLWEELARYSKWQQWLDAYLQYHNLTSDTRQSRQTQLKAIGEFIREDVSPGGVVYPRFKIEVQNNLWKAESLPNILEVHYQAYKAKLGEKITRKNLSLEKRVRSIFWQNWFSGKDKDKYPRLTEAVELLKELYRDTNAFLAVFKIVTELKLKSQEKYAKELDTTQTSVSRAFIRANKVYQKKFGSKVNWQDFLRGVFWEIVPSPDNNYEVVGRTIELLMREGLSNDLVVLLLYCYLCDFSLPQLKSLADKFDLLLSTLIKRLERATALLCTELAFSREWQDFIQRYSPNLSNYHTRLKALGNFITQDMESLAQDKGQPFPPLHYVCDMIGRVHLYYELKDIEEIIREIKQKLSALESEFILNNRIRPMVNDCWNRVEDIKREVQHLDIGKELKLSLLFPIEYIVGQIQGLEETIIQWEETLREVYSINIKLSKIELGLLEISTQITYAQEHGVLDSIEERITVYATEIDLLNSRLDILAKRYLKVEAQQTRLQRLVGNITQLKLAVAHRRELINRKKAIDKTLEEIEQKIAEITKDVESLASDKDCFLLQERLNKLLEALSGQETGLETLYQDKVDIKAQQSKIDILRKEVLRLQELLLRDGEESFSLDKVLEENPNKLIGKEVVLRGREHLGVGVILNVNEGKVKIKFPDADRGAGLTITLFMKFFLNEVVFRKDNPDLFKRLGTPEELRELQRKKAISAFTRWSKPSTLNSKDDIYSFLLIIPLNSSTLFSWLTTFLNNTEYLKYLLEDLLISRPIGAPPAMLEVFNRLPYTYITPLAIILISTFCSLLWLQIRSNFRPEVSRFNLSSKLPVSSSFRTKRAEIQDNLGLILVLNVHDMGAVMDRVDKRIEIDGETICKSIKDVLSVFEESDSNVTFYLWGLLETSAISRLIHGLNYPEARETQDIKAYIEAKKAYLNIEDEIQIVDAWFVSNYQLYLEIEVKGQLMAMVIGYPTKHTIYDFQGMKVTHCERFGNFLSPQGFTITSYLNEEQTQSLKRLIEGTQKKGNKVIVDFVPWVSPQALNEDNYMYFEWEEVVSEKDDIDVLRENNYEGVVLHLGQSRKIFIHGLRFYDVTSQDQLQPAWDTPEQKEYWKMKYFEYLHYFMDNFSVDGFRVDLAYLLPQDLVEELFTQTVSYARSKGKEVYFLVEVYSRQERDYFRGLNTQLPYYAIKTYYKNVMEEIKRNDSSRLRGSLGWVLNNSEASQTETVFLSTFDEMSLKDWVPDKERRHRLIEMFVLVAKAGYNVLFYLRDFIEFEGDIIPVVGGERNVEGEEVSYRTHKFVSPEELRERINRSLSDIVKASFAYRVLVESREVIYIELKGKELTIYFRDGSIRVFDLDSLTQGNRDGELGGIGSTMILPWGIAIFSIFPNYLLICIVKFLIVILVTFILLVIYRIVINQTNIVKHPRYRAEVTIYGKRQWIEGNVRALLEISGVGPYGDKETVSRKDVEVLVTKALKIQGYYVHRVHILGARGVFIIRLLLLVAVIGLVILVASWVYSQLETLLLYLLIVTVSTPDSYINYGPIMFGVMLATIAKGIHSEKRKVEIITDVERWIEVVKDSLHPRVRLKILVPRKDGKITERRATIEGFDKEGRVIVILRKKPLTRLFLPINLAYKRITEIESQNDSIFRRGAELSDEIIENSLVLTSESAARNNPVGDDSLVTSDTLKVGYTPTVDFPRKLASMRFEALGLEVEAKGLKEEAYKLLLKAMQGTRKPSRLASRIYGILLDSIQLKEESIPMGRIRAVIEVERSEDVEWSEERLRLIERAWHLLSMAKIKEETAQEIWDELWQNAKRGDAMSFLIPILGLEASIITQTSFLGEILTRLNHLDTFLSGHLLRAPPINLEIFSCSPFYPAFIYFTVFLTSFLITYFLLSPRLRFFFGQVKSYILKREFNLGRFPKIPTWFSQRRFIQNLLDLISGDSPLAEVISQAKSLAVIDRLLKRFSPLESDELYVALFLTKLLPEELTDVRLEKLRENILSLLKQLKETMVQVLNIIEEAPSDRELIEQLDSADHDTRKVVIYALAVRWERAIIDNPAVVGSVFALISSAGKNKKALIEVLSYIAETNRINIEEKIKIASFIRKFDRSPDEALGLFTGLGVFGTFPTHFPSTYDFKYIIVIYIVVVISVVFIKNPRDFRRFFKIYSAKIQKRANLNMDKTREEGGLKNRNSYKPRDRNGLDCTHEDIKSILVRAKDYLKEHKQELAQDILAKAGSGGSVHAVVIRHKLSNKSVLLMGLPNIGKASTAGILVTRLSEWELVAHWQVVFLFVNDDLNQLFIIQGPLHEEDSLTWVSVFVRRDNKMLSPIDIESNVKPTGEVVHIDGIVWYEMWKKEEEFSIEVASEDELREEVWEKFFSMSNMYSRFAVKDKLPGGELPIIIVRRTYRYIHPRRFEQMVYELHNLIKELILQNHNPNSDNVEMVRSPIVFAILYNVIKRIAIDFLVGVRKLLSKFGGSKSYPPLPAKHPEKMYYDIIVVCRSNIFRSPIVGYRIWDELKKLEVEKGKKESDPYFFRVSTRGLSESRLPLEELNRMRREFIASFMEDLNLDYPTAEKAVSGKVTGFTKEDAREADLILAVDKDIAREIIEQYPEVEGKIIVITEFFPSGHPLKKGLWRGQELIEGIPDLREMYVEGHEGNLKPLERASKLWQICDDLVPEVVSALEKVYPSNLDNTIGTIMLERSGFSLSPGTYEELKHIVYSFLGEMNIEELGGRKVELTSTLFNDLPERIRTRLENRYGRKLPLIVPLRELIFISYLRDKKGVVRYYTNGLDKEREIIQAVNCRGSQNNGVGSLAHPDEFDTNRVIVGRLKGEIVSVAYTNISKGVPDRYRGLLKEDISLIFSRKYKYLGLIWKKVKRWFRVWIKKEYIILWCYWITSVGGGLGWQTVKAANFYRDWLNESLVEKIDVVGAYSRADGYAKFEEEVMPGFRDQFVQNFGRLWEGIKDYPYVVVNTDKSIATQTFNDYFAYYLWLKNNGYRLADAPYYVGEFLTRYSYLNEEGKTIYRYKLHARTLQFHANNALRAKLNPVIGPTLVGSRGGYEALRTKGETLSEEGKKDLFEDSVEGVAPDKDGGYSNVPVLYLESHLYKCLSYYIRELRALIHNLTEILP